MSEFDYTQEERFDRDITGGLYDPLVTVTEEERQAIPTLGSISITVNGNGTTDPNPVFQLLDLEGEPLLSSRKLEIFLSSYNTDGDYDYPPFGPATASWGEGTWGGFLHKIETGLYEIWTTDINGKMDMWLDKDTATDLTCYICVVMPDGSYTFSEEMTVLSKA